MRNVRETPVAQTHSDMLVTTQQFLSIGVLFDFDERSAHWHHQAISKSRDNTNRSGDDVDFHAHRYRSCAAQAASMCKILQCCAWAEKNTRKCQTRIRQRVYNLTYFEQRKSCSRVLLSKKVQQTGHH